MTMAVQDMPLPDQGVPGRSQMVEQMVVAEQQVDGSELRCAPGGPPGNQNETLESRVSDMPDLTSKKGPSAQAHNFPLVNP